MKLCLARFGGLLFAALATVALHRAPAAPRPFDLRAAAAGLRNGQTLFIPAGTYTQPVLLSGKRNVTLQASGTVILDGRNVRDSQGLKVSRSSGVTLQGLQLQNWGGRGLFVADSDHVTVQGCRLDRCGIRSSDGNGVEPALLTVNSSDVTVEDCTVTNSGGHGVYFAQSGDRDQLVGCTIANSGGAGLQINAEEASPRTVNPRDPTHDQLSKDCVVAGNSILGSCQKGYAVALNLIMVQDSEISNNLIAGSRTGGISLWDEGYGTGYGSRNNRVYCNTVYETAAPRFALQVSKSSTGNDVRDNILVCRRGQALQALEVVQSDYNVLWGAPVTNRGNLSAWRRATGNDAHSYEGDPRLDANYRPLPGSPAIDAAVFLLPTDRDGVLRPQGPNPDLGCYEAPAG